MTGNTDLSSAAVKQWKHSVETFFRDEWSQLRQMVLELEEQGWGAEADTAGNECSPQGAADASDRRYYKRKTSLRRQLADFF